MLRQGTRIVTVMVLVEILTSLALGATATALGWQAYERRHDPLVLGLLGLAEFVPAVLLALPAGHVIDHHDRRLVAGLGLTWGTAVAIVLAIDAAAGDTAVWPLYVLAFAWGVGTPSSARRSARCWPRESPPRTSRKRLRWSPPRGRRR